MHYRPHNPYVNYGKRRTRVSTYLPSGQKVTPTAVVKCPRCGGDGIAPDCKHFIAKIECGLCGGAGFEKEGGRPIRSYPQLEALADQMQTEQETPAPWIGLCDDAGKEINIPGYCRVKADANTFRHAENGDLINTKPIVFTKMLGTLTTGFISLHHTATGPYFKIFHITIGNVKDFDLLDGTNVIFNPERMRLRAGYNTDGSRINSAPEPSWREMAGFPAPVSEIGILRVIHRRHTGNPKDCDSGFTGFAATSVDNLTMAQATAELAAMPSGRGVSYIEDADGKVMKFKESDFTAPPSAHASPVSDIGDIPEGWRMLAADQEPTYGDFWRLPQGKTWMRYADFLALTKNGKIGGTTAYWIRRIA